MVMQWIRGIWVSTTPVPNPTNLLTGLVMSGDQLLLVSCLGESIYGLI